MCPYAYVQESKALKEVSKVTDTLEGRTKEFYAEAERALRGLSKYHLAPGYENLLIDPITWNKWGPLVRQAHDLSIFRQLTRILQHLQEDGCC